MLIAMSWGSYTFMRCKCGKIYEVEDSTLITNQEGYNKCPICHSDGEVISSRSMLDTMKEQSERFKKRKKRIIL